MSDEHVSKKLRISDFKAQLEHTEFEIKVLASTFARLKEISDTLEVQLDAAQKRVVMLLFVGERLDSGDEEEEADEH